MAAGSLDGPCGPDVFQFGLHEAGENQHTRFQSVTLKGINFPLLIRSQNQNQDEIQENSRGWKNPRAQSPRILSVITSPERLKESSTASEGSSSCSATLWVSDRSAADVKASLLVMLLCVDVPMGVKAQPVMMAAGASSCMPWCCLASGLQRPSDELWCDAGESL